MFNSEIFSPSSCRGNSVRLRAPDIRGNYDVHESLRRAAHRIFQSVGCCRHYFSGLIGAGGIMGFDLHSTLSGSAGTDESDIGSGFDFERKVT